MIQPDLSVCLVTRNRVSSLCRALETLYDTADPLALEVIVVDNGSTDRTAALLSRDFPQAVCYQNQPAESFTRAMNRALRLGRGRYLGLLADTVRVQPRALLDLLLFLDNQPEAGMAAPRLLAPPDTLLPSAGYPPSPAAMLAIILTGSSPALPLPRLRPHRRPAAGAIPEVDWLAGQGQILRREMVQEIGYLREHFSFWFACMEYCRRARLAGWHLHVAERAVLQVAAAGGLDSGLAVPEALSRGQLVRDWTRYWGGRRCVRPS